MMPPAAVDNPLSADLSPGAGADAGDEAIADIEAARRDGTATVEQAILLMESQMDIRSQQLNAKITELEARLAQGGAPAEAAIRSLVARFTEAPANLHQATAFFAQCDPEDVDAGKAIPSFLVGLAIVGLQVRQGSVHTNPDLSINPY
jgi:hypothetical protein